MPALPKISAQRQWSVRPIHKSILNLERDCERMNLWKIAEDSITSFLIHATREKYVKRVDFIYMQFSMEISINSFGIIRKS